LSELPESGFPFCATRSLMRSRETNSREREGRMKKMVKNPDGQIVCELHAQPGARPLTLNERADVRAELGHAPMCEVCVYWDEQGQTACLRHAPFVGSDTWRSGRWKAIKPAETVAFR